MVKERRSAEDALALSPQIEEFISKGITSSQVTAPRALSIAEKPKQEPVANESSQQSVDLGEDSLIGRWLTKQFPTRNRKRKLERQSDESRRPKKRLKAMNR